MKEIKNTLEQICLAFELGTVLSFRTDKYTVDGYNVAYFDTSSEKGLKYIFKV